MKSQLLWLIKVDGLRDYSPSTINFFQHPHLVRITFLTIWGNGFFIMANTGKLRLSAALIS
ncbi:MAG: hypothetical protein EOP45_01370 [Sphingobacteriaceae bacterium]|nr:MAG: hypothetical protein EOP45_01370 [Sphingobacteriaceae bacterium]